MARNPRPPSRPPRLLPTPEQLGKEADAFSPQSQADQETLGTLVYISGATTGVGDGNTATSTFIASMSNSVYSQYYNQAKGK